MAFPVSAKFFFFFWCLPHIFSIHQNTLNLKVPNSLNDSSSAETLLKHKYVDKLSLFPAWKNLPFLFQFAISLTSR